MLVVVILVAFLFDWRTALISLTAIPLSLIAAVVVLTASGLTINTMVIAGLVIALGEVVDDAIIDVENIVRRLRLNRAAGDPTSALRRRAGGLARSPQRRRLRHADRDRWCSCRSSFWTASPGRSSAAGDGYVLAILASLLVALTVTPALSLMLLTRYGRRNIKRHRCAAGCDAPIAPCCRS